MTREPWECPRCHRVLARWMDYCDCTDGTGNVPAAVTLYPGSGSGSVTLAPRPGVTIAPAITATWPAGGTTTWTGGTFTVTNTAA